ncbi:MAG: UDP-N-acetylmuramoyl-L-alanine--D-glutamate ligase [Actinomycetota bacterium]
MSEEPGLDVAGRRVVVVGLGASGRAAVRVLADLGAVVRVSEAKPEEEIGEAIAEAEAAGADVRAGGHRPDHLEGASLLVASPGVREQAPILSWAREQRLPIWSELEIGARLLRCPVVAITGTNGKTTTTEWVAATMRADGLGAIACGNVGYPVSLAAREDHDALAVEVSSFQLRFHESFHPQVSVLLNLAPDHLDWHRDVAAYGAAKRQIYVRQAADDVHVGNRDDPHAAALSRGAPCRRMWFTLGEPGPGEVGYVGQELIARLGSDVSLGRPPFSGASLRADVAAGAAAALAFGIRPESVGKALEGFTPPPHRGEVVAEIRGVRFIDDSKATNPHAALAAIEGMDEVVLIAGGRAKSLDLSPLIAATPRLTALVTIGEAAEDLAGMFEGRVPVYRASSIEEAVSRAFDAADNRGVVLLAPACSSHDMFRDYAERGDRFSAAARRLADATTKTGATSG